jgi:hypothetical protein
MTGCNPEEKHATLFDYSLKTCRKCGLSRPLNEFYKNRSDCIPCNKEYRRRYYAMNRRAAIERARRWQEKNRERHVAKQRLYRHQNRERIQRANRSRHLVKKYGITLDEYEALSESQNHLCQICGDTEEGGLHVDHDHRTGEIRGLLCGRCNKAIGLFDDDPTRVLAAERYLVQTSRKMKERRPPR